MMMQDNHTTQTQHYSSETKALLLEGMERVREEHILLQLMDMALIAFAHLPEELVQEAGAILEKGHTEQDELDHLISDVLAEAEAAKEISGEDYSTYPLLHFLDKWEEVIDAIMPRLIANEFEDSSVMIIELASFTSVMADILPFAELKEHMMQLAEQMMKHVKQGVQ